MQLMETANTPDPCTHTHRELSEQVISRVCPLLLFLGLSVATAGPLTVREKLKRRDEAQGREKLGTMCQEKEIRGQWQLKPPTHWKGWRMGLRYLRESTSLALSPREATLSTPTDLAG